MTRPKFSQPPLLILLALFGAAGPVLAASQHAGPSRAGPLITDPTWTRRPSLSVRELRPPADAVVLSVDIECGVLASGDLWNCLVLQESQPDAGLAEAGLRSARRARASPETVHRMEPNGRTAFRLSVLLPRRRDLPSPATPRYP